MNPLTNLIGKIIRRPCSRLNESEVLLSKRLRLVCFLKQDGSAQKYRLEKVNGKLGSINRLDQLSSVVFPPPRQDFKKILSPTPPSFFYAHGSFFWRWTEDERFLAIDSDTMCFLLEREEVVALGNALFSQTAQQSRE